ncbi:DUF6474 family protein [Corynebacterium lowii]|uniref:Uncharacterized protein n=1 Tax=Corynebacterium lowii TaxID=1544413 RepID=A0A0Q1A9I5_9CORY|nr:DUF6474 family protein [Corynebacterium lowii]KQB83430.1 hypothetical protein Clow_02233 [Corynebacterium lowii]MDP9852473.1 vacuolar-type H+-ATPase subunit H [Corynebacterium lowii]
MGILKNLSKRRARSKAQIKAAKTRAKAEVKANAKARKRQAKLLAKQEKGLLKAEHKGLKAKRKHERKMAENKLAQIQAGKFNADNVKRWTGAARLLTPIVLPLAYRALTALREQANSAKAQKLGVTTDQMAQFSGYGAPLKARIHGIMQSLEDSGLPSGFVHDVEDRLKELSASLDNAEYMTEEQRRRAHSSISRDIDQVTNEIQGRLKQR